MASIVRKARLFATTFLGAVVTLAMGAGSGIDVAHANGRPPASSSIHFRAGHPNDLVVGMTWGVLVSHDGGATYQWMCEDAVGYGGAYDPDYEYLADGTLLATTFNGLVANRDGCTFERTPLANDPANPADQKFISAITADRNGVVYAADAGAQGMGRVHKSTDGGRTFPTSTVVGQNADWWTSIEVSPVDPQRIYLAGYRLAAGQPRQLLLYRSNNGGATFSQLPVTAFTVSDQSAIEIAALSPTNANVLFARVTFATGSIGDVFYRSADAGATWTKVLELGDGAPGFVYRSANNVYLATQSGGAAYRSTDDGLTFTLVNKGLRARCATLGPDGAIWLCGHNFAPDDMAIATTTDAGETFTKRYLFAETAKPVACAAGTAQFDKCQLTVWCGMKDQLGITSDAVDCNATPRDSSPTPDASTPVMKASEGCCSSGERQASTLALAAFVGMAVVGRRRKRAAPRW